MAVEDAHYDPRGSFQTDISNVLVIGAGAAGLRAAIAAKEAGRTVSILGKRLKKDAHTVLAAGGINAVLGTRDPQDSWEIHYADTMKEGYYIADTELVEDLCKHAPSAVKELAEWGCPFAQTETGQVDQRYFGAHRWRRTCYAGDWTGRAILQTLVSQAEKVGLVIQEHQYVWRLLHDEGRCFGALSFDMQQGTIKVHQADAVVLATGGHTRLWARSSSRAHENTGDGMALALEAGCAIADMEFVQFHPTGMTHPDEWAGTLVTEAVRGEGGHLRNASGQRFMKHYDAKRMELSTRDRVALANYTEIKEGRGGPHGGVFLDVTHLNKETIMHQLPRMYRQFIEAQLLDISKEYMEVAPTAHYSMGGIVVNTKTHETALKGLYAVGEVTCGVHGANRLGGNSLAETVVFGKIVGQNAAEHSYQLRVQRRNHEKVVKGVKELNALIKTGELFSKPVHRELREVMWECCGVVRSEHDIQNGFRKIESIKERFAKLDVRPSAEGYLDVAYALDLQSAILTAEATLLGAHKRTESRGAHQRTDYPTMDEQLKVNFILEQQEGELKSKAQPVKPVPESLRKLIEDLGEYQIPGRLLE